MSHTDLKLLSFLADSSPAVSTVIYYLVLFLVELIHLRNKKEKFREKERKKEREIFQNHVLQPLVLIGKMCFDQFSVRSSVGLETLELFYPRRLEWSARSCLVFILNLEVKKKWSVISLSSSLVFLSQSLGLKGDQKYSENLGSTIEEHRPCHFWSSTIGGVTESMRHVLVRGHNSSLTFIWAELTFGGPIGVNSEDRYNHESFQTWMDSPLPTSHPVPSFKISRPAKMLLQP
ncbi:hypothetical protein DY000_02008535 [Brassica cretica]|uniref:Uncharacterized protein n=1 Tax=Brassica cretica TaxID=69181 RepID=A0ABQ7BZM6_BRACR|nr:hypothetical protein DY000_02008535 [Brassica cretica]